MKYYAAQRERDNIKGSTKSAATSGVKQKNGFDIRTVIDSL